MTHRTALATAICLCAIAAIPAIASAAAPTIPHTALSNTTTASTTLEADLNPQGKATKYHFEYGSADCSANPCTSTPEAQVAAGTTAVRVSAPIEGLSPGTTYHFRAVARHTNEENGETKSPDRTFTTFQPPQIFEPCPNDAYRAGANLPDCRAYEQATPPDKNGGDATNTVPYIAVSENGDRVTFLSDAGFPGGQGSQEIPLYLATRGAEDWSTQGLLPPGDTGEVARVLGWSPDLSQFFDRASRLENPASTTFMARSSSNGAISSIYPYEPGATYFFAGSTPDGAVLLFETGTRQAGLPGESGVYAWDRETRQLSLVSVMNDGSAPARGAFAGPYDWAGAGTAGGGAFSNYYTQEQHVLAADGSAAYFTAAGSGQLYARLNPLATQSALDPQGNCTEPDLACTIHLNATHKKNGKGTGGADPAGAAPAAFMGASADGTKALFTSTEMLTDDANTGPEQEPPAVVRSDLDGTPANIDRTFVPAHASGIAVDSEHVYWVDPQSGMIGRAKLDGTDIDSQFITATEDAKGVAVAAGYIYWTNGACEPKKCEKEEQGDDGTIGRAQLNGDNPASDIDQGFIEGARNPWAVAANAEHVYWTSSALVSSPDPSEPDKASSYISRAELDGTKADNKFLEGFGKGRRLPGIALDGAHVYWMGTDPLDQSGISRADLDGDNYLISFIGIAHGPQDEREPHGRGIAVQGDHIYWAAEGTSWIGRAQLNGDEAASEIDLEFISDAGHPYGIAADASHLYWSAHGEASPNPGNDLYRYDSQANPDDSLTDLTDLTPDPTDPNGAGVRGVLGSSRDVAYVYFAANGDLDGPDQATPGNCSGPVLNETGSCNVYVWHEGQIRLVARLTGHGANWVPAPRGITSTEAPKTSRVTPDGRTLLFASSQPLTAYDSEGRAEFFRYYAPDESLICVTCNPTGEPPSRVTGQFGGINTGGPRLGSINITALEPTPPASTTTHVLSDDGNRVFFETTDSLSEADTNYEFTSAKGEPCPSVGGYLNVYPVCMDVYEWEAQGAGTCQTPGGCQYLLSRGTEEEASLFGGVSASGDDVFIFTRAQLVGRDTDFLRDAYDIRVGGGLASQYPQAKPICEAEACKPAVNPPAPIESPPAFAGPVNPRPACPKGKRRAKNGRCVAKKHRKAKKHQKRNNHRAGAERRTER